MSHPEIDGAVLDDQVLGPGAHWAKVVKNGHTLKIVDLQGKQAVDLLCYNAQDPSERYNAADTMKYAGSIFLSKGHNIYSDRGRVLFAIIEDTCGRHDTIGGCCSSESNRLRYGLEDTPNCRDNFLRALEGVGLGRKDIVSNLNFFMNVPVEQDGSMALMEGFSVPGDYVNLRAEMDVLTIISNCPQVNNPVNGYNPSPIRLIISAGES